MQQQLLALIILCLCAASTTVLANGRGLSPLRVDDVCPSQNVSAPIGQTRTIVSGVAFNPASPGSTGKISSNFFPSARSTSGFYLFELSDGAAPNKTQARYSTFNNNRGDQVSNSSSRVPNITDGSRFTVAESGVPVAVVYGPSSVATLLTTSSPNYEIQLLRGSSKYQALVDTGIVVADTTVIRFAAGYTLIQYCSGGACGANRLKYVRSSAVQELGVASLLFGAGNFDAGFQAIPSGLSSSTFTTAMDVNGLIIMIYRNTDTEMGVSYLQTFGSLSTRATTRTTVSADFDGSSQIQRMYIATAGANNFLVVMINAANKIYSYNSGNAFQTAATWMPVGTTVVGVAASSPVGALGSASGSHDFALYWTSTGLVNFFEMASPNIYAWSFNFANFTSRSKFTYPNSTYGSWPAESPVLMYTAAKNFSRIRFGGITGFSYNFLMNQADLVCDSEGSCTWSGATTTGSLMAYTCGPWTLVRSSAMIPLINTFVMVASFFAMMSLMF